MNMSCNAVYQPCITRRNSRAVRNNLRLISRFQAIESTVDSGPTLATDRHGIEDAEAGDDAVSANNRIFHVFQYAI